MVHIQKYTLGHNKKKLSALDKDLDEKEKYTFALQSFVIVVASVNQIHPDNLKSRSGSYDSVYTCVFFCRNMKLILLVSYCLVTLHYIKRL